MFRWKASLSASALVLAVAGTPAFADTILFDPTGGGAGTIQVDTLDMAPGTAKAEGITVANAAVLAATQTPFTLKYQANVIGTIGPGADYASGALGQTDFFTVTAQFDEVVTGFVPVGPGAVLTFDLAPVQTVNEFSVWATNAPGNDLTGAGFGVGTLILQGHAVASTGPIPGGQVNFGSNFQFQNINAASAVNLDQINDDDYPAIDTLQGFGTATIPVQITFVDSSYFEGINMGDVIAWAISNTSLFTPFTGSDPSAMMFDGTPGAGANLGTINGLNGVDTLLNADAQSSFRVVQQVPEPTSLTLLGLGLLGTVSAMRRRQRKN